MNATEAWAEPRQRNPAVIARLAADYLACAQASGQGPAARQVLAEVFTAQPGIDLLRSLSPPGAAVANNAIPGSSARLLDLLKAQSSLSAVIELLDTPRQTSPTSARQSARDAVALAARPLQRYRCAACGFEAQRHFWQCPGCLGWVTFLQQRIEEL